MKKVKLTTLFAVVALISATTVLASTSTENTYKTSEKPIIKKQLKSDTKTFACSPYPYCKREERIGI